MCYNGFESGETEDEREGAWVDPDDASAESWKDQADGSDGDGWKERYPSESQAGGDYWLLRGMAEAEDEDDRRSRGKRQKRNDDEGEES